MCISRKALNAKLSRQTKDNVFLPADRCCSTCTISPSESLHRPLAAAGSRQAAFECPNSVLAKNCASSARTGTRQRQSFQNNTSAVRSNGPPICGDSFYDESLSTSNNKTPPQNVSRSSVSSWSGSLSKEMQTSWQDEGDLFLQDSDLASHDSSMTLVVQSASKTGLKRTTAAFKSPASGQNMFSDNARRSVTKTPVSSDKCFDQNHLDRLIAPAKTLHNRYNLTDVFKNSSNHETINCDSDNDNCVNSGAQHEDRNKSLQLVASTSAAHNSTPGNRL